MYFYLSSYKVGNQTDKLIEMVAGHTIGFIPNALDYVEGEWYQQSQKSNMKDLTDLWIKIEYLDLKDYFQKPDELQKKINTLWGIWIRWGNTYILRQAMRLSGLDGILQDMQRDDFLYGGYSAGPCVAGPTLQRLDIVDNPTFKPYGNYDTLREWLNLIPYCIAPHYKSDHHESELIEQEVQRMIDNKVLFKALKDWEVIIINNF